mgnify:CR=1 FL=1
MSHAFRDLTMRFFILYRYSTISIDFLFGVGHFLFVKLVRFIILYKKSCFIQQIYMMDSYFLYFCLIPLSTLIISYQERVYLLYLKANQINV